MDEQSRIQKWYYREWGHIYENIAVRKSSEKAYTDRSSHNYNNKMENLEKENYKSINCPKEKWNQDCWN